MKAYRVFFGLIVLIASFFIILRITGTIKLKNNLKNNSHKIITQEEAMNSIRKFEGDQSLKFKALPFQKYEKGVEKYFVEFYPFELLSSSGLVRYWEVNTNTGEVNYVNYGDMASSKESIKPYGNYTLIQCKQIALKFIQDKYYNFDNMGFKISSEKWDRNSWQFSWSQYLQNGAVSINFINIGVNPDLGQVEWYVSERYTLPSFTSKPPKLSPQEALKLAVKMLGITSFLTHNQPKLRANPDDLYYYFSIEGKNAKGKWKSGLCSIDANSGAILSFDEVIIPPNPDMLISKTTSKSISKLVKSKNNNLK